QRVRAIRYSLEGRVPSRPPHTPTTPSYRPALGIASMCEPVPTTDAAGSEPLQRAKLFPIASCRTLSPASSQRSFSHARAFRSVGGKTNLVTAGASASENEEIGRASWRERDKEGRGRGIDNRETEE